MILRELEVKPKLIEMLEREKMLDLLNCYK